MKSDMLVIGIAGGSGSGKSTLVRELKARIPKDKLTVIEQDSYYADLSHLSRDARRNVNFDEPGAIDFDLLCRHLRELRKGCAIDAPVYSFEEETRSRETEKVYPRPVIIVEGILILCHEELRGLLDFSIFVDTPPDLRLLRRILRDVKDRGHGLDLIESRYLETVRPMYRKYVGPSMDHADFVISGESPAGRLADRLVHRLIRP